MRHDQDQAQKISNGHPAAFAAYVDAYGPRLHRLARKFAGCEADAEDLTQEIFIALHHGLPTFRGGSTLSTWTYRVALNHCLKYAAKARPVMVPYDEARDEPEAVDQGPASRAARNELSDRVHDAMDGLSSDHRDIVILHEMHDLTYAECAAVLQVPIGTVKSRLSYAFRRLRGSLSEYVLSDALPESTL